MATKAFHQIFISSSNTNSLQKRISELAQIIVQSWDSKVASQILQSRLNSTMRMPEFRVYLTTKQQSQKLELTKENKTPAQLIIIAQQSSLSPGHLLAMSGQLSTFGQKENQFVPSHVTELVLANSIAILVLQNYVLFIREINKQGVQNFNRTHKISYIDCLNYYGAFNVSAKYNGLIPKQRGSNILDGGAPFYAIYPTKKGLLAVGNLEPKFYNQMIEATEMPYSDKSFCLQNQLNIEAWPKLRQILGQQLMRKTALQWQQIMNTRDTCVTVVIDLTQIPNLLHPVLLRPKL